MSIEFNCPNLISDPKTDKQKRCSKKLRAPDDKAGLTVTCPSCRQPLVIPATNVDDLSDGPSDTDTDSAADQSKSAAKKNSFPGDRIARCPKCGDPLNINRECPKCKDDLPPASKKTKTAEQTLDDIQLKPAGFQRWLINILSEGLPVALFTIMGNFLFGLVAIGTGFLLYFSYSGLMLFAMLGLWLAAIFFYVAWVYKSYDLLRNPNAKLAWFQRPFWNFVLWSARRSGWKSEKSRIVIDRRNTTLSDDDLDGLEDIKYAGVLDLEGTQITDDAFRFFYRMKKLECLVLRGTDVSHHHVVLLQQAKPKLWVWH